jgi:hypothetical protein
LVLLLLLVVVVVLPLLLCLSGQLRDDQPLCRHQT